MKNTHEDIVKIFDCYCKRVIKNEARDFFKKLKKQRHREVSIFNLSGREQRQLVTWDKYTVEQYSFCVYGAEIAIDNPYLGEALSLLPKDLRNIILLYYFLDMTDREIGSRMLLLRATVQYRRKKALRLLQRYFDRSK